MPETLAFWLPEDRFAELHELRAELPAPVQLLGPVATGTGDGWSAFVAVQGSVRGLTVVSEAEQAARRVELRREAGASSADWSLVERLARRLAPEGGRIALNQQDTDAASLDALFAPDRLREQRASEWRMIHDRFFRAGRGRAVLASPLFEITVNLEDVTFPGELIDHLEELEKRLSSRVQPMLEADVVPVEQTSGEGVARFRFARWRVERRALVPEVDRVLVIKGAPVGFIPVVDLMKMLGARAEISRQRPPRRILLPALDARTDASLLAVVEKTARAKPPVL